MGYLDNSVVEIDAILTKKGRELLSKGANQFKITQFALADDEIDYRLWNPDHTLGSNYYGEVIENMPVLEANPNETQVMKYKLLTLQKTSVRIPVISVGQTNVVLESGGQTYVITPVTTNFENGNATYGYTATISDRSVASIEPSPGYNVNTTSTPSTPMMAPMGSVPNGGTGNTSQTAIGFRFLITAKTQLQSDGIATITIIGNETGGRVLINLTVRRQEELPIQITPSGVNLT